MGSFEDMDSQNRDVRRSSIFLTLLACLLTVISGGGCDGEAASATTAGAPDENRADAGTGTTADPQVVVTYFHTTFRCPTCRLLEQYARETVERDFAGEIGEGKVVYRVINVDDKENQHFVDDYGLYTKSLIVSLNRNGEEARWKNLPDIWKHVRNRERFEQYVKQEIEAFLEDL